MRQVRIICKLTILLIWNSVSIREVYTPIQKGVIKIADSEITIEFAHICFFYTYCLRTSKVLQSCLYTGKENCLPQVFFFKSSCSVNFRRLAGQQTDKLHSRHGNRIHTTFIPVVYSLYIYFSSFRGTIDGEH